MIQQLEKVDTHDIEPMAHPLNMKQRLRLDLVTEENRRELYQKNAVPYGSTQVERRAIRESAERVVPKKCCCVRRRILQSSQSYRVNI